MHPDNNQPLKDPENPLLSVNPLERKPVKFLDEESNTGKLQREPGNRFNYLLGKIMEKHKIEVAMMMFHPGGAAYNGIEVVYINDPSIEWVVSAWELFCKELEERSKRNMLPSFLPSVDEILNKG